jgi:anthranilate synthase component 1
MKTVITESIKLLSDTVTPVAIFLKIRDRFLFPCLLESNDYRSSENSNSLIGFEPLASMTVENGIVILSYPGGETRNITLINPMEVAVIFKDFMNQMQMSNDNTVPINGFVGHTNFDAVRYFDTIKFDEEKHKTRVPDMHYIFYRYLININHFKEEMYIIENRLEGEISQLDRIKRMVFDYHIPNYDFALVGEESSNLTDEEYKNLVSKGKYHCQIGDVFQIVLSRQFRQQFKGDDFKVYRVLRSINPSPYLYYFDYGSYKIFGSSPESQLVVKGQTAYVNPIAGTYKRTGKDEEDAINAEKLMADPKENSEHIMLVDLARNDLGRHCHGVKVQVLKEVQYFSHVIHLVSKVAGQLDENANTIQIFGDTFPAGTLSGAPKYKAIELINQYENINRSFYGGGIGFFNFNGNVVHAIIIRSFLSLNNVLYRQAGAGIVSASVEESELQEVNNKLGALKRALVLAEQLN